MSRASRWRDARHAAEYRRAGDLLRHLTAGEGISASDQAAEADPDRVALSVDQEPLCRGGEFTAQAEQDREGGAVSAGGLAGRELEAGEVDANPLRAAWIEASDRYDELFAQQEADPEAPLGQRITTAYYARQDAFNAMYEGTSTAASREVDRIVDAHLGTSDREAGQ